MTFPALPVQSQPPGRFPVVNSAGDLDEMRRQLDDLRAVLGPGQSWTPALTASTTDPTTSAAQGWRMRTGNLQRLWGRFVIDTSGGGSGTYTVVLPVAPVGLTSASLSGMAVGSATLFDSSTSANRSVAVPYLSAASTISFMTVASGGAVTATNPFTWAVGDVLAFYVAYPIAGDAT